MRIPNPIPNILVCILLTLLAAAGVAAENEATPSPPDEAGVHFHQGVSFYKSTQFEQAAIEFSRAYELKPSYKILFNIAQTENMLRRPAAALDAYRAYLEQGGDAVAQDRRAMVEAEIAALIPQVGELDVRYASDGAVVIVDNEERGTTPLDAPLKVDIGKHELRVLIDHRVIYNRVHKVVGGQRVTVAVPSPNGVETTVIEPPKRPDEATPPASFENETAIKRDAALPDRSGRTAALVTIGAGAVAAVSGAITGGIALSKKREVKDGCDAGTCVGSEWTARLDTVTRLGITTDVLIGLAAIGIVSGVAMLVVPPTQGEEEEMSLHATPTVSGGAVVFTGRF